jgi:hypothetical protein
MALTNLGIRYGQVSRRGEAVPPTEEAVGLYRQLAADNPAFVPDLAGALGNLGNRYGAVGRRTDAVPPTEEAVRLRRQLAADNPAFAPDLAGALGNLGIRYREVGRPEAGDQVWREALASLPAAARAELLYCRCAAAETGLVDAVGWLVEALKLTGGRGGLTAALHDQARRHRTAVPPGWDAAWTAASGQALPGWLTLDPAVLELARGWVATSTYPEQRDYLASHQDLLDPTADNAVAEALLGMSEDVAGRYQALRDAASQYGVHVAYRPQLLQILAAQFAAAEPEEQRRLLDGRHADLLDPLVRQALAQNADDDPAAVVALSLLELADNHNHLLGDVFSALAHPDQLPDLLSAVAEGDNVGALGAAAMAAAGTAHIASDYATALFFAAVAAAVEGNQEGARQLASQAAETDPADQPHWIAQLAGIGSRYPAVLDLIPHLITLAQDAATTSSADRQRPGAP